MLCTLTSQLSDTATKSQSEWQAYLRTFFLASSVEILPKGRFSYLNGLNMHLLLLMLINLSLHILAYHNEVKLVALKEDVFFKY